MKTFLRFFVVMLSLAPLLLAADAPGFKVTKRYPVPGNGGFDEIVFDGSSNRLYVSHGTEVDVLDADSGTVLGKIEDTPGRTWDRYRSGTCTGDLPPTAGRPPYRRLIPVPSRRSRKSPLPMTRISSATILKPIGSLYAMEMRLPSPPSTRTRKR